MQDNFILGILAIIALFHIKKRSNEVEIVKSKIDGRSYLVRSLPDKVNAANLLAKINRRLILLVDHMKKLKENFDEDDVNRLIENFNPDNISEGSPSTSYTSYSINKGEKIVFCLRSKDDEKRLIDINTIMYVAIHEMGHLMTKEIGHPPSFWKNFRILLNESIDIGIYEAVNYSKKPVGYCGIKIKGSILFKNDEQE